MHAYLEVYQKPVFCNKLVHRLCVTGLTPLARNRLWHALDLLYPPQQYQSGFVQCRQPREEISQPPPEKVQGNEL